VGVNLSIKGVPDAVAAGLRARAAGNHRSLQRELMAIVEVAASRLDAFTGRAATTDVTGERGRSRIGQAATRLRPIEEIAEELRKLFPRPRDQGPSSAEIVRRMRDGHYGDSAGRPLRRRQSG
jgi:plasmid stability protein